MNQRSLPAPLDASSTPLDVARCESLDVATRRRLLEEWRDDEADIARAAAEGMNEGPSPKLAELERALDDLESSSNGASAS